MMLEQKRDEFSDFIGTEKEMCHWIETFFVSSHWGKNSCTIFLNGDLGAGKSTFVRHFLRCQGIIGNIKSPTYSLIENYTAQKNHNQKSFYHFDLYRIQSSEEWTDMGFDEYLTAQSGGWCFIEWPYKVFPKDAINNIAHLVMHFESIEQGSKRKIRLEII